MPRRKKIKISAKETSIYNIIVDELSKNAELATDYEMQTIEISILKNKLPPRITDVGKAINNLERYVAINGKSIQVFNGEQIITKKDLANMLGITRPTLDKWIQCGFIKKAYSTQFRAEYYQTKEVLEQLRSYKA